MRLLDLQGVEKRFKGAVALSEVNFDLLAGEVHVLFGENGAGKSTLINVVAGTFPPDAGRCFLEDREIGGMSPAQARRAGISVVFQEFSLVPQLTVVENLFLGNERTKGLRLDHKRMRIEASEALHRFGFDLDCDARIGDLARAQKQMVEIAKALLFLPKVLILDEPTASLSEPEAANLFRIIGELKAKGVGIVYVSHRLAEIRLLADRITVLRDGRLVKTAHATDVTDTDLIALMAGRPLDRLFPAIPSNKNGKVRLSVRDISLANGRVHSASLNLRAGEVVGIGGLVGSGQSEFIRGIFGLEALASGSVSIDGIEVGRPEPAAMLERRLTYFPADRVSEGLALSRLVRENASISSLWVERFAKHGVLRLGEERTAAIAVHERLRLRPASVENVVETLSGGNRQKVLLARGLMRDTDIFLFDEPTVGIDVNAKLEIYELLRDLVAQGAAVLMVSSDLQELIHLSHRLIVFRQGAITAELVDDEITEANALTHFFGKAPSPKAPEMAHA